ncbi:MAG: arylsulfotransferase family protein [Candidatus Eisenbacteria bacterium]
MRADAGRNEGAGHRPRRARRVVGVVLLALVVFGVGFASGVFVVRTRAFPYRQLTSIARRLEGRAGQREVAPGRWRPVRGELADAELSDEQLAEVERLMALGYVGGSVPAGADAGVTVHDAASAFEGLNFVVSGHAPEALLADMDGRVLHRWARSFEDVWPGRVLPRGEESQHFWRRAHLYPNGDVLAIFEGLGLIKLDSESKLLWVYDGFCHHDLDVLEDGTILVLEREPRIVPRFHDEFPVLEDFIAALSPEGELVRRVSILKALERSDFEPLLRRVREPGDIFHTNTLEVLDGTLESSSPAFARGNVLISILMLDTVAVVDLDGETVPWALAGRWRQQHQPTMLPNGRMLVFDNEAHPGASSSVELDPLSQEVFWRYEGSESALFYTSSCGSNQRLPNGNTLLTESDNGRAIEVTPDGAIVWEFVSPYRAGDDGEYVATLFEIVRLDPGFPLEWMSADGP